MATQDCVPVRSFARGLKEHLRRVLCILRGHNGDEADTWGHSLWRGRIAQRGGDISGLFFIAACTRGILLHGLAA